MKKKLLIMLTAMFGMALHGMAQMTLTVPKWDKFIKVNTEGVNLRKAANVNSPKLMSCGTDWNAEFSWTPKEELEPFHPEAGAIFPVVKETADWYCLYFNYNCYGNLVFASDVYILKKFCTEVSPATISNDDYEDSENTRVKGNKGYYIGVYYLGSPSRAPWCRIGHNVGKYLVMADYDGSMDFARRFCTGENVMEMEFDIDRVKDSDVLNFIGSKKKPSVFDIWIKFPGRPMMMKYVVDTNNYKYPMEEYTF